jgi:hypothetical protein
VILRLQARLGRRDRGRAIVEFLVVGLLVLVPIVYFVVTLSRVQAAAFAAATTEDDAYVRAGAAARISFEDYDFGADGTVGLNCDGSPCLRPEGRVEAVATVRVRLPLIPGLLSGAIPAVLPVSATHVATVDRFRGR